MKKEIIFAIIAGLVVGAIVVFGVYTANQSLKKKEQDSIKKIEDQPSRLPPQNTELTIISPEENAFTDQEQIVVAGKSVPLADVLLLVNEEEYLTTTDDQGNFSFEVTLLGGSNALSIYVTLQDGKQIMETRMVVFSTADFDAEEATSSAKTGKTATTSGTPSKAGTP